MWKTILIPNWAGSLGLSDEPSISAKKNTAGTAQLLKNVIRKYQTLAIESQLLFQIVDHKNKKFSIKNVPGRRLVQNAVKTLVIFNQPWRNEVFIAIIYHSSFWN